MRIHRFIIAFLALSFVMFAALQYNDPDPAFWIGIYMVVVLTSGLAFFRRLPAVAGLILTLSYLAGAIYVWPPRYDGLMKSMSYSPAVEEARESLGLFICALALSYYTFLSYRSRQKARTKIAVA